MNNDIYPITRKQHADYVHTHCKGSSSVQLTTEVKFPRLVHQ